MANQRINNAGLKLRPLEDLKRGVDAKALDEMLTSSSHWYIKKFADKLKQMVCLLIGCTLEQLEDMKFKETPLGEEWRIYEAKGWNFENKLEYNIYTSKESIPQGYQLVREYIPTPRNLLQLLGTECGRKIIHPNIWINALMADYKRSILGRDIEDGITYDVKSEYPNWIITDVRFPNEAETVISRYGLLIRIERPLRPSSEWQSLFPRIKVLDPDGWDRRNYDYSWGQEMISIEEYRNRVMMSSCIAKDGARVDTYIMEDTHESETSLDNYTFDARIINDGSLEDLTAKTRDILRNFKLLN